MAAAKVLFVRIPEELSRKLDARVARAKRARRGHKITKSDVVRELLLLALERDA